MAFWQEAEGRAEDEQRRLWREHYAARHPTLFALHDGAFGAAEERLAEALPRFAEVASGADARFRSLRLPEIARSVESVIGLPVRGRVVAFVGTFGPMAWYDRVDGDHTAFFALEMLDDLAGNQVCAAHELAHLTHFAHAGGDWPESCPGQELILEGVALNVVQRVVPHAPAELVFFTRDFPAFEAAVDAAWSWAIPELLACFDTPDPEQTRRFFWPDWGRGTHDVPQFFGYLAGERVVRELLREHELATIVSWSSERARAEARAVLEAA
ncbi:MAG TPA: hypothetical protein VFR97_06590 [Capillimicrobium sp.]|nr:hypothetical protein [Capillimicrobium sp.]